MTELEYKRLSAPVDRASMRANLSPERRNAADAMRLLMNLNLLLNESIAERSQHAYRRISRVRKHSARRLERRYKGLAPTLNLANIHKAPTMPRPQQQAAASTGSSMAAAA